MRRTHLVAAAVAPLVLVLTSACSGSEETPDDPATALEAAKGTLDETPGLRIKLSTDKLPEGVDGVIDATGIGTHAPAFEGDVKLIVNSLSVDVPVVAVEGQVFAKLPFTTTFAEIEPSDYGAPDPAQFMATTGGISDWLTEATDVAEGEQVREGEDVLTTYDGTLPGAAVAEVIPSADEAAEFPATFRIDDEGRLVSAEVTGPFYGAKGGEVAYTVTLSDYGTDKDIVRP